MKLIAELQRRNVLRMAGLYLVGAWLLVQVAGTLLPVFGAPAWMMKTLVALLAVGVLPVLAFSWAFELTPDGLRRDDQVTPARSIAPQTGQRLNRIIVAVLALALLYFGFDKFVLAPRREAALVSTTRAADQSVPGADRRSIAVLPFVNMSGDKDNDYFSDGISEEILNVLARTPDLHVAARTSSFSFKGKPMEVPAIARELEVRMVLEGSVRKQGDRVRITAQLIDAKTGFHVWSQTYDRQLQDIFAIQDEIAGAIGKELEVKLADARAPDRNSAGTRNLKAYDLYLRGIALWNTRQAANLLQALALFDQAAKADPRYAEAYAGQALVYTVLPYFTDAIAADECHRRASDLALRALALNPNLPEVYAVLGNEAMANFNRDTGRALLGRAIALRPSYATAHQWLGTLEMSDGDRAGGLAEL